MKPQPLRTFIRAGLSACCLMVLTPGCMTNPVTGKRELAFISEDREIALGASSYAQQQQAQGGAYVVHPSVTDYIEGVTQRLAAESDRPHLPYEMVVLNNSVPNAWALPGGKMAINRGLLTELGSEAELAAVLSHEIVHVAARHGAKAVQRGAFSQLLVLGVGLAVDDNDYKDIIVGGTGLGAALVGMKYSRGAELESDQYGMQYMARAGYDPTAAVTLQETFVRLSEGRETGWLSGLFASHPPSQERVGANRERAATLPQGGLLGKEAYARAMQPLLEDQTAYAKMDEGYMALRNGQPGEAGALARQAIAIQPREAHFHHLLAKARLAQDQPRAAVEALDRAIALNDGYFGFHQMRGRLRKDLGDRPGARQDLMKSINLLPTASAHYDLGAIALDEGRTDEAGTHFRVAATADSDDGNKARAALARLELPTHPERHLRVAYDLDRAGQLIVTVQNPTPVNIAACSFIISAGGTSARFAVPGGLPAGGAAQVATQLGPFPDVKTALGQAAFRFDNVSL